MSACVETVAQVGKAGLQDGGAQDEGETGWGVIGRSPSRRASAVQAARLGTRSSIELDRRRDHPGRTRSWLQLGVMANVPRSYVLAFPHGANGCTRRSHLIANGSRVI
jgi:hypothetical protein